MMVRLVNGNAHGGSRECNAHFFKGKTPGKESGIMMAENRQADRTKVA